MNYNNKDIGETIMRDLECNRETAWDKAISQTKGRYMTKKRAAEIMANYRKIKKGEDK